RRSTQWSVQIAMPWNRSFAIRKGPLIGDKENRPFSSRSFGTSAAGKCSQNHDCDCAEQQAGKATRKCGYERRRIKRQQIPQDCRPVEGSLVQRRNYL